jgi:anti-anti-sigma regulatory factor/HAMP domain-containing protein
MLRTLTRKILVLAIPLFLSIAIAVAISITNLLTVAEQTHHLGSETIEQMRLSMEYNAQMQRLVTEITSYTYSGNPEEHDEAEATIRQLGGIIVALEAGDLHAQDTADQSEVEHLQAQRGAMLADMQSLLGTVEQHYVSRTPLNVLATMEELEELEESVEDLSLAANAHIAEDVALSQQSAATATQFGIYSIGGALAVTGVLILVAVLLLQRNIVGPIGDVSRAAAAVTQNDLTRRMRVTSRDEVGSLQQSFNQMVVSLQEQHDLLEQRNQELATERASLEQALAELHERSAERTALLESTVEQLSAPILPVRDGVLVMPIIGSISEQRAVRLQETLLQTIAAQHTRVVILDVTGMTSVDTAVVQALLQTIQSTLLLGARPIVVGINPAMASTLVQLGTPLDDLHTMADLKAAVAAVLPHNGQSAFRPA